MAQERRGGGDRSDGARTAHGYLVVTMLNGSYSLGEAAAKLNMIRVKCPKCGRAGQYRIDRLIEEYGPDIAMPDLRHELAQCPHWSDMSDPCQVEYVDRVADLDGRKQNPRCGRGLKSCGTVST
jgi:hypothetical protein